MRKDKPAKIKYTGFVATSIDGRIAKSGNSGTDWTSPEDWKFFQKALSQMDAVIVGHNTYKTVEDRLKKRNTLVLTSKVKTYKAVGSVTFLNPKSADSKAYLRTKKYKSVGVVGGAQAYDFCLKNKMLDRLFVTIEPYVFTAGVPMFSGKKFEKYKFTLLSVKKLNKRGTILLEYKYKNKYEN